MKWQFSYKTNFFAPIFVLSLATHAVLINAGRFVSSPVEYSVVEAPNSVEVMIVEEQIMPQVEEVIIEEVLATKQTHEMLPEVKEQEIVEESIIEKFNEPEMKSEESQGAISEAKPLNYMNPAPLYPHIAKRRGWEGKVLIKVFVESDGTPSKIEVQDSSGYKILDDSAMKTVYTWRFEPARSKAGDISTWVVIPIHFKLVDR